MIELFTIFNKGGLVLWCFQEGIDLFTESINALIRDVIMQERGDVSQFKHNNVTLKFKLDNEFELVFVVVYQSIVQLSYADKLLDDVSQRFRDLYKNVLENKQVMYQYGEKAFTHFGDEFSNLLRECQLKQIQMAETVKKPKAFQESAKSQKTIDSLIISRAGDKDKKPQKKGAKTQNQAVQEEKVFDSGSDVNSSPPSSPSQQDELAKKREEFFKKKQSGAVVKTAAKSPEAQPKKKGKQARVWELGGTGKDAAVLDYSAKSGNESADGRNSPDEDASKFVELDMVGKMKGDLKALRESDDEGSEEEEEIVAAKASGGGWFSAFKGLVGSKKLTAEDLAPALEKMKESLILKNVAAEPADQICQSVSRKLEGKVIGTFTRVNSEVKAAIREALTQLLTPKRRVDILRDVVEAKREGRPYVIVFCGVNGVGKSTNLAKITFWLNENGHRVLIAAGDTFRAGAVEQLRTHSKHLNALHANSVHLFEQGYGKDSAGLAMAAIADATQRRMDVVLVDTAGRMQDNEPLMRELAKLIRVNEPDLVLFVGEALVGNEAVDQLVKFNQALSNHATPGSEPRLIDGIVLTKFDTIDDKVGAAVSMTYITGQPIVFVGCGQTYSDLRSLNVGAVVNALLK
ncbi:hypothetical protein WR25_00714 [Diploscapter pachys]|uniref:SRP54-type proteins GTP-binding domain-containing protein n=1 Tax=Diploscapter pachys TaxID=2018661 RepID=A0A2A2LBZ5_9BILA|nr:hypothetical protein WR25_00714 [Diploscapter pachys]